MKKVLAILLLFCISYQYVAKVGVIAWYEVNKDYVAQELCENKDKPQLECNGKCYLKKQLNKVDNETPTDKEAPAKKHKNELPEYLSISDDFYLAPTFQPNNTQTDHYRDLYHYTLITSVFHPPSIC